MGNRAEIIGSCRICGDDLYLMRTKSHHRLVKCLNEDCDMAKKPYFLPKAGQIEPMGETCPLDGYPIVKIVPILHTKITTKALKKQTYYWAKGPCFACKKMCDVVKEWMIEDNPAWKPQGSLHSPVSSKPPP